MDCSHLPFVFLTFIEIFQKVFYVDRECLLLQRWNVLFQIAGALEDTLLCANSFLTLRFVFFRCICLFMMFLFFAMFETVIILMRDTLEI